MGDGVGVTCDAHVLRIVSRQFFEIDLSEI